MYEWSAYIETCRLTLSQAINRQCVCTTDSVCALLHSSTTWHQLGANPRSSWAHTRRQALALISLVPSFGYSINLNRRTPPTEDRSSCPRRAQSSN